MRTKTTKLMRTKTAKLTRTNNREADQTNEDVADEDECEEAARMKKGNSVRKNRYMAPDPNIRGSKVY